MWVVLLEHFVPTLNLFALLLGYIRSAAHVRAVRHYFMSHDSFKSSKFTLDTRPSFVRESREGLGPSSAPQCIAYDL